MKIMNRFELHTNWNEHKQVDKYERKTNNL